MTADNSQSFKFKAALVGKAAHAANESNSSLKNTKYFVPLKYLSKLWISLEIALINWKTDLELNWNEECISSIAEDSAKFKIADAKLHVPIVTLSTKDNANLTKELSNGFKRPVFLFLQKYLTYMDQGSNIYELLSASFQGIKRLFALAYAIAANAANNETGKKENKKYIILKGKI